MKLPIYARVFLTNLLVLIVLAGLILAFSLGGLEKRQVEMEKSDLLRLAWALQTSFAGAVESGGYGHLDSLAKDIGRAAGIRLTLVDREGRVLAESESSPDTTEKQRTRPEMMRALRGEVGISRRLGPAGGEDILYVAVPMKRGTEVAAVLSVGRSVGEIGSSIANLRNSIILLTAAAVVLAFVSALVSSRSISGPIRRLAEASKRVAAGDFGMRVFLKSSDEIRDLADSFNRMVERLEDLFSGLSRTGEELRSIVTAMRDSIIVLDGQARVLLTNASFRDTMGVGEIEGKPFWEVLRAAEFADLVRSVVGTRSNQVREITLGTRVFLCSGDYLPSTGGVVAILHDITEIRGVERLKKDFVVNLSHELRTPLTAIKGFLETLEGDVTDEGRRYLSIIRRHTDRLGHIVDDLLLLSELEDRLVRLEIEKVDLEELIEDLLHIFEEPAKAKNLRIEVMAEDGPVVVRGDRFKLEQVFINLIANAVKYTERGGVTIRLAKEGGGAIIRVEDTGIGIPEEHQPRIFERFYVVDKSRSRRVGGTGLGLAIVKHIVLLHNGSVEVESSPGRGSRFIVKLPDSPG
jgi:two-component system phosphate regulon sensor histidine kinase PhoR